MNINITMINTGDAFFKAFLIAGIATICCGCSSRIEQLKADETVQFIRTAGAWDEQRGLWQVPLHAWVYEPADSRARAASFKKAMEFKYGLEVDADAKPYFKRRVNLLLADNERGKALSIDIAGGRFNLPETNARGHVSAVFEMPATSLTAIAPNQNQITTIKYHLTRRPEEKRIFEGEFILIPPRGISVISDIDDTVKITEVTDRKSLLSNTFYKPFLAVEGMAQFYQSLDNHSVPIHYVSSSPWQLYQPLDSFLRASGFPKSTLSLKTIRFKDKSLLNLLKKGTETKPKQIIPILESFPDRKFILIGDSGEQDPEVYADIAEKYPNQIVAIFIRKILRSNLQDARFKKAREHLGKECFVLFEQPIESINCLIKLGVHQPERAKF